MMQQRSTVDSRRHLTNIRMLVHQCQLDSLSNYCLMLNQVLKVSPGTLQQFARMLSKSATFLDFQLSQGSVATYSRGDENLCGAYIENFLANQLVKEL